MKSKQRILKIFRWVTGLLVVGFFVAACSQGKLLSPEDSMTIANTPAPSQIPSLMVNETTRKDFLISDFDAVHAQVSGDPNKYLILGNLSVSKPAADLPPELAGFLGRWEGFDYSPPVKKDWKWVLVIQKISAQDGEAVAWRSTNLQYPSEIKQIHFRVNQGKSPSIEWETESLDGNSIEKSIETVSIDNKTNTLKARVDYPQTGMQGGLIEFNRTESFFVYKDYSQYLASKRIYSREYQDKTMQLYGNGYLLYLPEGYEDNPTKTWPLILFFHGSGDRGDNINLIAKASPFMMIREKGPLPFIIVAPLLKRSQDLQLFPIGYMDGVLAEVQKLYQVDPSRIYLTGLSLGGEAAYHFAIDHPDTFAAIAPLSAFLLPDQVASLNLIKDLPVWAIHGANDTVIPLARAEQPVNALKKLGGNIRFTVLEDNDHDTWTDTYSDPAFYDWLLQNKRP
jgi:predicted esterase